MSFNRMKYTPEDGLKNMIAFPMVPVNEDAAREQFQRLFDQVTMQVNTLMAALESTESGYSGAENVGVSPITGVSGATVHAMLENLKTQMDGISAGVLTDGLVETKHIKDGAVSLAKMAAGSVGTAQLADAAVTGDKLSAGAISGEKLGVMRSIALDLRPDVGADKKDSLEYDAANRKLKLSIAGITSAQLAPVVYGTSATISGSYPAGTIYVQYAE